MSDGDIDFLLDDATSSSSKNKQRDDSAEEKSRSFSNEDHFAADVADDEEEEDGDGGCGAGVGTFVDPDDCEWTENDVRQLIVRIGICQQRFAALAPKMFPHPLIWVPVSAAAQQQHPVAGCHNNNNNSNGRGAAAPASSKEASERRNEHHHQQQLFVNGLAKLKHKIDSEMQLLAKYLAEGNYGRARCNNLRFLEIAMRVLEIESPGGVLFFMTPIPLRTATSSAGGGASSDKSAAAAAAARRNNKKKSKSRSFDTEGDEKDEEDDNEKEGTNETRDKKNHNDDENDDESSGRRIQEEDPSLSEAMPKLRSEIDIICRGGLRWIKIRGSSARNLESDCVVDFGDDDEDEHPNKKGTDRGQNGTGENDDEDDDDDDDEVRIRDKPKKGRSSVTPFVQSLARLSWAVDPKHPRPPLRLPFGKHPELIMVCAQQPTEATLRVLEREAPNVKCISAENDAKLVQRLSACRGFEPETIVLDVTTLVSLCSDVCNGFCIPPPGSPPGTLLFPRNPVLQRQADAEAAGQRCIRDFITPVLKRFSSADPRTMSPDVRGFLVPDATADTIVCATETERQEVWAGILSGKELPPQVLLEDPNAFGPSCVGDSVPANWVVPVAAMREFCWIVSTISGPLEKQRCLWLCRRLRCVDTEKHPEVLQRLSASFAGTGANIKSRQLNVFSVADTLKGVVITANKSFLHSSFEQGQLICAAFTPARALTERKRLGIDVAPKDPSLFMPGNRRTSQVRRFTKETRLKKEQEEREKEQATQE